MNPSDEQAPTHAGDLVVIGSSAGGVEALSILVSSLPPDFPAPIVLAQHLDPNRPSMLSDILRRRASLPVDVVDQRCKLEPGTIYVVSSNHHVAIADGHVEVMLDHMGRPMPSVDRLLSTAAASYGERLIAVILTGSGSDGAAGAVDVKHVGGTVIIQDPGTARYPSMPLSLPPTAVDFTVSIDRIGPLLHDLLTGVELSQPNASEDTLQRILKQISGQANIDFSPYKRSTVLRRIGRRMTVTHHRTLDDYARHLEANPQEVGELVQALLINVTQFFRDAEAFAYVKQTVLPELLAQARSRNRVLRLWSAGCASGEEPYSLAMLVADLLGAELPEWSIKIFATDLDGAAINFARLATYPENVLTHVSSDYRERFFARADHGYRIAKTLRQMVIFGQQDLSRSAPFPRVDLVLCRNVLIYFTPELQDYVLNQFAFSLRPNTGYLFLGKAESVRPTHGYFELVSKQWKVYQCTGEDVPMLRRQTRVDHPARLEGQSARPMSHDNAAALPHQDASMIVADLALLRRANEMLLRFLPVGVVVIDSAYHVVTVNTAARRLLGLHEPPAEQDFLHAVRGIPYTEVRAAIDSVFRERTSLTLPEIVLDTTLGGNGHYLSLTIVPMQVEGHMADLVAINVTDVTDQVQARQRLEAAQAEQAHLVEELGVANKRLGEINKELLDANEELQVTNEEMMLTYEELQAMNEEFEATNEELQATNEELETNNEELQATNEELQTTNEELRARTSELQELTTMLEGERRRLAEMVELAPFYIMVLRGPHLIVEAFNSRYAQLLEGREARGRPLEEVARYFWQSQVAVIDLVRQVYATDTPRTTPRILAYAPNQHGGFDERSFAYTVVPTHDGMSNVDGVVIYAADVTEQRAQEVLQERERLRLIFEHAQQIALGLYDAESMELLMATPQYADMLTWLHGAHASSFIGGRWSETTFVGDGQQALQLWEQVCASREALRLPEIRLNPGRDGHETVWTWTLIPIMDPEQPHVIRFMMVLGIEITEQVQAREDAQRLDHLKDEFLSLASHELRTPLTSLVGNAYILERMVKEIGNVESATHQQQILRYVDSFKKQLERLNVLIEDLIDVSRLQSGKYTLTMEPIEIRQVVRQAVEEARMLSERPPIVLRVAEAERMQVCGDSTRLMQVLLNLLQNAITYAPRSERIDLRVELFDDEGSGAPMVQIAVQDDGPGIAAEDQAAIFSRFYQTKHLQRSSHRGLGLGLFICKEIVEQHGGRIGVASALDRGSTFWIQLPLYSG
jgi:two-component system CheB/CheR fusion protein